MSVSEAVAARKSVRAFTSQQVDPADLRRLLVDAAQAASGGNVQPWRLWVLTGEVLETFRAKVRGLREEFPMGQEPEYDVYPPDLWEPYRSRRFKNGQDLYAAIGIPREDKAGRRAQFGNNFDFFGAPAAVLVGIDRRMGPPQWSDVGMYLQNVMLLAVERGLATCPQETWTSWHKVVYETLDIPEDVMLFCGLAIGYEDLEHPINTWRSDRADPSEWIDDATLRAQ
ncbi:nitroreductase [Cumulibacter manganitolerans]|uniref:nitroreductase n=1 Tax=Cumulibacter manganitolerans TaxID=1884992 RepID=UPI0012966FCD|nr:nitroreductase [Cumulibacter manganitolerans]